MKWQWLAVLHMKRLSYDYGKTNLNGSIMFSVLRWISFFFSLIAVIRVSHALTGKCMCSSCFGFMHLCVCPSVYTVQYMNMFETFIYGKYYLWHSNKLEHWCTKRVPFICKNVESCMADIFHGFGCCIRNSNSGLCSVLGRKRESNTHVKLQW